ncbi:alpha/beta hydrolase family protein [Antarctobacter jejuensis]|uniref:alpha/beta hydrolase family protein n=1 Tax=Antarctobacter jejuensis TaxID=1439938 RepID=UPI003FD08E2D
MKHLMTAALIALGGLAQAQPLLPGFDRMDVQAAHRARPLEASFYYPAANPTYMTRIGDNPIFKGVRVFMGPRFGEGRHPLVLFSHGSGGSMDNMAWLLAGLAERGAIVLTVNHPGSTSGDSSPRRSVRLDERALDLSAALDQFLAEPEFAGAVDPDRIYSLGFSLGGATALGLAGLRFDAGAYAPYCEADTARSDCAFFDKGGVDFRNLPEGFSADARDPRVTGAMVIDPAFTFVATQDSVQALDLPTLLINLGKDRRLGASDMGPEGSDFAARLPQAQYVELAPAIHFTALPECKPMAAAILEEEQDDPICTDPEGTDRGAVHAQILQAVAGFMGLE